MFSRSCFFKFDVKLTYLLANLHLKGHGCKLVQSYKGVKMSSGLIFNQPHIFIYLNQP